MKFLHYPHILYIASPNSTTLSCKLNWRHYVEFIKGDAPLEADFYVILIKSCLFILFPKCVINAAFRKQNNIPYFLGQLIYVALYQCIILYTFQCSTKPYWLSMSCEFWTKIGQIIAPCLYSKCTLLWFPAWCPNPSIKIVKFHRNCVEKWINNDVPAWGIIARWSICLLSIWEVLMVFQSAILPMFLYRKTTS